MAGDKPSCITTFERKVFPVPGSASRMNAIAVLLCGGFLPHLWKRREMDMGGWRLMREALVLLVLSEWYVKALCASSSHEIKVFH